ncbi:MAG: T9SS type A sorting domain-containing protein [Cyclobacteriaceae bacterium]
MSRQVDKIITSLLVLCVVSIASAQDIFLVNALSDSHYGMESSDGWWMQHPANWSLTSLKSATGDQSLKYSNATTISEELKAHGSASIPEMEINLEVGQYTISSKVYIEADSELSGFQITFKPGNAGGSFIGVQFDFTDVPKEQWTEISTTFTLTTDMVDYSMLVIVGASHGGKGTFYVDDFYIPIEGEPEPPKAPQASMLSDITSASSASVNVPAGAYIMTMKVFKESSSVTDRFYTTFTDQQVSLSWDISSIEEGVWVSLQNKISLQKDIVNSPFKVQVPNLFGSGVENNAFYIDDISLILDEQGNNEEPLSGDVRRSIQIYPNPASQYLSVEISEGDSFSIYNASGTLLKEITDHSNQSRLDVSELNRGIYLVKVLTKSGLKVEKLIIE